jgi:hypothetical protein
MVAIMEEEMEGLQISYQMEVAAEAGHPTSA